MNMPMLEDGSVQFTTTLFALIRESLSIKYRDGELHFYIVSIIFSVYFFSVFKNFNCLNWNFSIAVYILAAKCQQNLNVFNTDIENTGF